MALCLFESMVRLQESLDAKPKTGEELLVEIVDIVSLKFARDEATE